MRRRSLAVAATVLLAAGVGVGSARVVSLYANMWNELALRAYGRVGFEQTATFATVMF
jgi:predicted GNAT family acetyltransferase